MTRFAVLVSLLLGGCFLDTHQEADDTVCNGTGEGAAQPAFQLRDPSTGTCQVFSISTCDSVCGPCPDTEGAGIAVPNWPSCSGVCEGLAEDACTANPECHAAYAVTDDCGPTGDCAGVTTFDSCWDIAPLAPTSGGGACATLDPFTCAVHTDCVSRFSVEPGPSDGSVRTYLDCADETPGLDPGTCDDASVRCNIGPPACPDGTVPGVKDACWSGYCIPTADCPPATLACGELTDEAACVARAGDCEAEYVGEDCTCDAAGNCTCESEKFDHCQEIGRL